MRVFPRAVYFWLAAVLFSCVLAPAVSTAAAQATPSGQVAAPGSRNAKAGAATNCGGTDAASNAADPNCVEAAPGFAVPTLEMAVPDTAHAVTALVRVDTVMPRPPVALAEGNTFSVVGSATLIKVRRANQDACLATGKRISARVNAATSTTCLDHKGDLLALQECKAGTTECTVATAQDIAQQQTTAAKP